MAQFRSLFKAEDERSERIWEAVLTRLNGQGNIAHIDKTKCLECIRLLEEYQEHGTSLTDEEIVSMMEAVLRNPSVHRLGVLPSVHLPSVPDPIEISPVPPEVLRSATPEEASLLSIDPLAALVAALVGTFGSPPDNSRRK